MSNKVSVVSMGFAPLFERGMLISEPKITSYGFQAYDDFTCAVVDDLKSIEEACEAINPENILEVMQEKLNGEDYDNLLQTIQDRKGIYINDSWFDINQLNMPIVE